MLYSLGEPFKIAIKRLGEVEVAHVEVIDDGLHALDKRRVSALKDTGSSYGLKYSVHAPFADMNIASPSKPILRAVLKRLKRSIAHAGDLDAHVWVLHPGFRTGISMFCPGKDWLQNLEVARLLSKIADDHGVMTAMENVPEPYPFLMKSVEDFIRFYEEFGEGMGLALDVGHANLGGQIEPFLTTFKGRITHIHVSDNDGKADQHLGVGYGCIDWGKVAGLIKNSSYGGAIIVESVEHVEQSISKLRELLR